ncbi:tape measure protein [Aeromonas caviae]
MGKQLRTEIVIDLAGNLAQKAKQYSQSMHQFAASNQRAMEMMKMTTAAASRGIDTLGNRFVAGAAVAAIGFERTFIKTAAEFERYQIMLNKLQGSPQGGAEALSWIKQLAQETPYAVDEITQSFVKLKAFGLDPMDGTMQAIADQAAMMGGTADTIDGIALALGQAWTKGKLQGEEALQLLERGVPVWDYLAKASKELGHNGGLGYSTEQLQKMASQGDLTRKAIKDLVDQMGEASKGAAKAQMNSWNGMISNMGDHWKLFQADVMDSGAFEALKVELNGLLSKLDEMKKTGEYDLLVEKIGTDAVDAIRAFADGVSVAKEVGEELLPILDGIGQGAKAISDVVGGYGELAKILAGIYVINKGLRLAAPLAQGAIAAGKGAYTAGSWLLGKRKGKGKGKGLDGLDDIAGSLAASVGASGAMPVYVVNMPGGGFNVADVMTDVPTTKTPASTVPKSLQVAKNLAPMLLRGGLPLSLMYIAGQSEEGQRLKAESDAAQVMRATLPQPDMVSNEDAYALMAKSLTGYKVIDPSASSSPSTGGLNFGGLTSGELLANAFSEMGMAFGGGALKIHQSPLQVDVSIHEDRPATVRVRERAPGLEVRVDNGPSLMTP